MPQPSLAGVGDLNGAAAGEPANPAELEQALGDAGAERSGQVRSALGPVQAGAGERTAAPAQRLDVDPQRAQPVFSRHGQAVTGLGRLNQPLVSQRLGQADPKASREVVVTGPSSADRGAA